MSLLQTDRSASAGPGQCDVLLDHLDDIRGRQRHMDHQQATYGHQIPSCIKCTEDAHFTHSENKATTAVFVPWLE